jgi:lipoprotein signal peptidase
VLFGVVAVGWIIADQLSKAWALSALDDQTIDLFWTLRFQLAFNYGASFSLGAGFGAWIGLLALVVVGVLVWKGGSVRTRLGAVALGMIVGGALGNVLDRAFRGDEGFFQGGVVDFIGVVCGAILLVISTLRDPDAEQSDGGAEDGVNNNSAVADSPSTTSTSQIEGT